MKTKLIFLMLLSIIFLMSTPTAKANFYQNPGFEDDTDDNNIPDVWDVWYGDGGAVNYVEGDAPNAQEGEDYLELSTAAGGWCGFHQHNLMINENDTDVVIGCWVRDDGKATTGMYCKYEFYDEPVPDGADETWKRAHTVPTGEWPTYIDEIITPGDGQWHYYYFTHPIPRESGRTTASFTPVIYGYDMSPNAVFMVDNVYGDIGTEPILNVAMNPNPRDKQESVWPTVDQFTWENPDPNSPDEPVTCDVWFTDNFPEYDIYPNDPNFTAYAVKILDKQSVESVTIPGSLEMDKQYFWRVDCYFYPDDPEEEPSIGYVWTFDTINRAPSVDAGIKQNLWLEAGSVTTILEPTVTDDGLPLPSNLTYEWTQTSGPAVSFDDTAENPEITFTAAGEYVFSLTASDGLLNGTDAVTIMVYLESYTGLVAHWKLDETAGTTAASAIGGHVGTLIGDPTWAPDGQVNGALLLDGDGDYIQINDSVHSSQLTWADYLADEVTLSIWMKTSDGNFGDDWAGLLSKGSNAWRIQRYAGNDTVEFAITVTGEGGNWVPAQMAVNDDKWHHVVGAYTGDMMYIYVDGVLQGSTPAGTGTAGEEYVWIGAGVNVDWPDADYEFNGMIDEARIYEVGLPADRVLDQYIGDDGPPSCGGLYETVDLNRDCYIDLLDLLEFAADYMSCTDVTNEFCN